MRPDNSTSGASPKSTARAGEIFAELDRLRKLEVIRLVDLVVVAKSQDGDLAQVQTSDLTVGQAAELGAIAGALVGFGAAGEEGAQVGAALGPRRRWKAACSARRCGR